MAERNTRRQWIVALLGLAAVVALILYIALSEHPAPPEPQPEPAALPSPEEESGEPPFAGWLRYEPEKTASQAALGTYFIDAVLGHRVFRVPPRGVPAQIARGLILDDDELLLSSGRRLWTRKLAHQPGLGGEFCYMHSSYCLKRLFEVSFAVDGAPVVLYDNTYSIDRFPSHTRVRYELGKISVDERKLITWDDRAVATYEIRSSDGQPHTVTLEVFGTYPPVPGGGDPPQFPLLGSGTYQGMPIYLYMDAPGFERLDSSTIHLKRNLEVGAADSVAEAVVAVRFQNEADNNAPAAATDVRVDDRHTREYNRWFADNVPYFDSSDAAAKKMWYYRWWIVRFHLVEAATPDLTGPAFYEGKLGFDNVIGFAVPAQLKELTYLRDPRFGLSQARNSYRNRSPAGAVVDPPGSPYWNETYSHWNGRALLDFHRIHPLDNSALNELLPAMAADVRAWLSAYDRDGDALPERERPRVTGYDLDILSYWFFNQTKLDLRAEPPFLERVDFASFVYANAAATAELAKAAGDEALARDLAAEAERVRAAALAHLWDENDSFFYPQSAASNERIPIRELHAFFPFTFQLAPDEARYVAALAPLVDPMEFWARYPPVITSQRHYRSWSWEMDGLTRNIAPHPISMGGHTLIQVLKHYRQQQAVTPDHFMHLLARYNELVYPGVHPSDALWRPNVHEYYSEWEPHSRSLQPKPSDISHDFHSMYCALIVEGAVGLTPRSDAWIELQPLAQNWDYFLLDRLRYRNHDLTVVWDRPDGTVRYPGLPEGFSLLIDGQTAFTRPSLDHVRYDPSSKTLDVVAPN